jgi:NAD(P)-dependent dehydrogenase (short-subunit alcohol dehydrogenase family)
MAAKQLDGKTALVTGAGGGIGLWTAIGLARKGARVLVHARSMEKADKAVAEVNAHAGSRLAEPVVADLALRDQVRALADDVAHRAPSLDMLVNNAAIIPPTRTLTADGLETQFMVNHLSYFMLGNLLLPSLRRAPAGRIVNVSSGLHHNGVIEFDNLQGERVYARSMSGPGWGQYSNTKLMNVLFTNELARRLAAAAEPVTANSLHPGVVATSLTRAYGPIFNWIYSRFVASPEKGARTSIYVASSPDLNGVSGEYFGDEKREPMSEAAKDLVVARRLWDISIELSGVDFPERALA